MTPRAPRLVRTPCGLPYTLATCPGSIREALAGLAVLEEMARRVPVAQKRRCCSCTSVGAPGVCRHCQEAEPR